MRPQILTASAVNGTAPDGPPPFTLDDILSLQIYAYCTISAGAILILDHLLTFDSEVSFIWRRRFTGATLLFILNRYTTLIKIIIGFSIDFTHSSVVRVHSTLSLCQYGRLWYNILDIASLFLFGAFTAFRVWAIWGRELRPFLLVLPLTLVVPSLNIYRVCLTSTYMPAAPIGQHFVTCMDDVRIPISLYVMYGDIVRGVAISTDFLVLILTWIKTFHIYSSARRARIHARLAELLLRDGTIYFGVLLVFNVVDMIVNHTNPGANPVNYYNEVFNCILISRFMLNLRRLDTNSWSNGGGDSATYNNGKYDCISTKVLGDLAAPLGFSNEDHAQTVASEGLDGLGAYGGALAAGLTKDEQSLNYLEDSEDQWDPLGLQLVHTLTPEERPSTDTAKPLLDNVSGVDLDTR